MNIALKMAMVTTGVRQKTVAEKAGIHLSTMSLIVNERRTPTPSERKRIAKALKRSEAELWPEPVAVCG